MSWPFQTQSQPATAWALVVMGVSGSGKSSVAQALAQRCVADYLDADDFHSAAAKAQMASGVPLTDAQREPWVARLATQLQQQAAAGRNTVLAFSGLRSEHRQHLRSSGVPMRFVFLHASAALIAQRLAARGGHFMSPSLLDSQFQALQPPTDEADVISIDVAASVEAVVDTLLTRLPITG
jgi:gluconokinase